MSKTAPDSEVGRNRRRLLINPKFQTAFAVYAVISTLLLVPFFLVANSYFFDLFAKKAASLGLAPDHELVQFMDRQQALLVVVFLGFTILMVLVNIVVSYILSNRIAGSLYRVTNVMNQTTDLNNAGKAHPRNKDFFNEVLVAYNSLIDRLK